MASAYTKALHLSILESNYHNSRQKLWTTSRAQEAVLTVATTVQGYGEYMALGSHGTYALAKLYGWETIDEKPAAKYTESICCISMLSDAPKGLCQSTSENIWQMECF